MIHNVIVRFISAALIAGAFVAVSGGLGAQTHPDAAEIDRVVLNKVSAQFGINSKVIAHISLTEPFQTKSPWTFVAAKQPDEQSATQDGALVPEGPVSLCLVKGNRPDCSQSLFLAKFRERNIDFNPVPGPFYKLFASDVVFSGPERTLPLLRIVTCTAAHSTEIAESRRFSLHTTRRRTTSELFSSI